MKKMRNLMAAMMLVGVMGTGNVFAQQGTIPPSRPRPVIVYTVSSLFGDVYDYFADLFAADDAEQTNDVGDIPPTSPKPAGIIHGYTNDAGIIHIRP